MSDKIRILYVDDCDLDRVLVRDALGPGCGDYQITEATDRHEFEELLASGPFDLVLSDLNIRGYEGLQVIDTVRSQRPDVPVVIVTGSGSEETAVEAMKRGASDYVIKTPEHIRRLTHTIAAALENARLQRETRRRLQEVNLLSRVITLTNAAEDLPSALTEVCNELGHFYRVERAGFARLNPQRTAADVVAEFRRPGVSSSLGIVIPVADNPSMAYVMEHKTPLAVVDAQTDPIMGSVREIMRQQQVASILIVPILIQDQVAGTLGLDSFRRREFSRSDIDLARHVASQVGQALERLELLRAARAQAERLARLAVASEALNRPIDAEGIVAIIGKGALALSGADRAALYIRSRDDTISCPWSVGLSDSYVADAIACVEKLPAKQFQDAPQQPVLIADVSSLPDDSILRGLAQREGFRSVALWPLTYEGEVLAAIACYGDRPRMWSEAEQEIMQAFTRQAAVVLENSRLYESLHALTKELQNALQAKRQMIQSVSHELRTPLTLIMGYTELLSGGALGSLTEEQLHALAILNSQSEQLLTMVNRLLTLQTLDKDALDKVNLSPIALLDQAVREWQGRASQAGLRLRLRVPASLPNVLADPYFLTQVLDNLIENAIKFSLNDGVIEVGASLDDHEVVVSVADQGIGIPADQVDRLFERFTQVDRGATRQFGGMGIGLALCREIIEVHDGRVWAESAGKDQGSTFYFALPLSAD